MSRNRPSTCPHLGRRPGSAHDGHHATAVAGGTRSRCPQKLTAKSSIPKRGPPPAPPRKIDYKNPQMTRAMAQRMKHTQKLQEELERKELANKEPMHHTRRPRKTTAPPPPRRPPDQPRPGRSSCPPSSCRRGAHSKGQESRSRPGSSKDPCPGAVQVPEHTINLAKTFNADIVQAEPMQRGPVDNIIIPPGAINSEKTTIVSIPLVSDGIASSTMHSAKQPNKSILIINETLDEQDALEYEIMNSKLQDLQQARRDLMMTVAGFGSNSLSDDSGIGDCADEIADISPPSMLHDSPGELYPCPDPEDPYFKPEYGVNHPVVEAAREYLRCRQSERKFEDEFARIANEGPRDLDNSQPEFLDEDEDDCVPRREPHRYESQEIDRLERFFDTKKYPPRPHAASRNRSPPAGRKDLHPDLWDIDDPWYSEPESPDLIDWNSNC